MQGLLRAGVIGAGVFGAHHGAKYATMAGVELAAVFDTHPDRAAALAARFGAEASADLPALLAAIDIVSVASPASSHARLALAGLEAGKAVYVEKPFALTLEDADALVRAAAARGSVLACGFQERAALQGLRRLPVPLRIEARRLGPPPGRGLDVSVVLDLMIHDLDLALALGAGPPLAVEAEGSADDARAEVLFEGGLVGVFAASRIAAHKERFLTLAYSAGEVRIDLMENRLCDRAGLGLDTEPGPADRLGASLAAFVAAVGGERPAPLAGGQDGARALDLALAVEHALGR